MMLAQLPVKNCHLFLHPHDLSEWMTYEVSGVVGVFEQQEDGQYAVVDVFHADCLPTREELLHHERMGLWEGLTMGKQALRFDVFPTPLASPDRRREIVELVQRSCGVRMQSAMMNYRRAA
jgi:hypothetical protein